MEFTSPPPQSKSASAAPPLVPTPPAEVFIRTLESDLRSLRESGGARPKAERIVLSPNAPEERQPRFTWFTSKNIEVRWLFIAAMAAIALVGILVYGFFHFSLPALKKPLPVSVQNAEELQKEAEAPVASTSPGIASPSRRAGIFRKTPDQTLSFIAASTIQSIDDLKTPVQRFKESLGTLKTASSSLIQIFPTDSEGTALSLSQTFSLLDFGVLNPSFLSQHFETQFGMFVYKNGRGWWPGYILALRPGENWLFLKEEVGAFEESSKLSNFYLDSPGGVKSGFRDMQVGDVTARVLEWTAPDSKFIYGWFRGYLILSTSQAGLEAVLPRL